MRLNNLHSAKNIFILCQHLLPHILVDLYAFCLDLSKSHGKKSSWIHDPIGSDGKFRGWIYDLCGSSDKIECVDLWSGRIPDPDPWDRIPDPFWISSAHVCWNHLSRFESAQVVPVRLSLSESVESALSLSECLSRSKSLNGLSVFLFESVWVDISRFESVLVGWVGYEFVSVGLSLSASVWFRLSQSESI